MESPLWDSEDVAISPNRGSATNRYHLGIADLTKENVGCFQSGENLQTGLREYGVRYESSLKPIPLSPPNRYALV
jgi:phosphoglycerate dehydrogenase-like enzyme